MKCYLYCIEGKILAQIGKMIKMSNRTNQLPSSDLGPISFLTANKLHAKFLNMIITKTGLHKESRA